MAAWWASALGLLAVKQWVWDGRHRIKWKLCCESEKAKYPKQLFLLHMWLLMHLHYTARLTLSFFPFFLTPFSSHSIAVLLCAVLMSLSASYSPSPWLPLYLIPLPCWCTPTGLDMQNLPAGNGGCSLHWSTQLTSTAGNYGYLFILCQHYTQLAFSSVQLSRTGVKSSACR